MKPIVTFINTPLLDQVEFPNSKQESPELTQIIKNESIHFPVGRTVNFFVTLAILFTTSMMVGTKYQV